MDGYKAIRFKDFGVSGWRQAKGLAVMSNRETQSIDSKKKSASEAFVNSFGGYPIGYALGIVILPLSTGWIQEDPLVANLVITFVYATVSFVRSYFLRRIFEKYGSRAGRTYPRAS